ncbi:MAG TPA: PilN domain-containing protein [Gaiellaceae bacterium]|nr:PilN domain-containing protein [Gaiellaceae bacterium]
MRAVNLLPSQLAAERKPLPNLLPLAGAVAVPVISVILVGVGYSHAHSTVTSEQAELAAVQAHAPTVTATAPSPDAGLIAERSARLTALQTVLAKQVPWDVTFSQLGRLLPSGVWLTSLTAQSPTPEGSPAATASSSSTGGSTTLTVNGYALTDADLALLMQRLALLPALTNLSLPTMSTSKIGNATVLSFTITGSVEPAGTPPATNASASATSTVPATTSTQTTTTPTQTTTTPSTS